MLDYWIIQTYGLQFYKETRNEKKKRCECTGKKKEL